MDEIQTFVSVAQQVIDTAQQVITKVQETQEQQVASKETQQVVSKETQQVVSKETRPQDNKYFWNGVMATFITGTLLYTMTLPRVTHERKNE